MGGRARYWPVNPWNCGVRTHNLNGSGRLERLHDCMSNIVSISLFIAGISSNTHGIQEAIKMSPWTWLYLPSTIQHVAVMISWVAFAFPLVRPCPPNYMYLVFQKPVLSSTNVSASDTILPPQAWALPESIPHPTILGSRSCSFSFAIARCFWNVCDTRSPARSVMASFLAWRLDIVHVIPVVPSTTARQSGGEGADSKPLEITTLALALAL